MATNEILTFATTNTGTNLLTQAEYTADAQRVIGHQPGIARSKLENKVLRQASLLASGLAEFIADYQSNNVTDSLTPQNIADYLRDAISSALAVTPPQFDNDTSLATTEFVRRQGLQYAGTLGCSSNTNLTAAHAGYMVFGYGTTYYSIVLPQGSTVVDGTAISVYVANGAGVNIQAFSGNQIIYGGGGFTTNFKVNYGDTATFVYSGGSWHIVSGTAQVRYAFGFESLLQPVGWQKLPTGMILQWGQAVTPATNGQTLTIYFPIAFPTYCASFTHAFGPVEPSADITTPLVCVNKTNSYAQVRSHTGADNVIEWKAVGY
jgi:hypothetical protein